MRALLAIILTLLLVAMVPITLLAVILLTQSDTNQSRFFAVGIMALAVAVHLSRLRVTRNPDLPLWAPILTLMLSAGLFILSYQHSPTGNPHGPSDPFQSVESPSEPFLRWHPANLVAERDQVKTALTLASWLGRFYGGDEETSPKQAIAQIYDEIDYMGKSVVERGSQLHRRYHDLAGRPLQGFHAYLYRSPNGRARSQAMPVLMLLHGEAGNLQAAVWALKPAADQLGVALLAPSLNTGQWEEDSGREIMRQCLQLCQKDPTLDANAIVLAGYGRAGAGLNMAARRASESFRGFVHVGTHFSAETIRELTASSPQVKRPILVMHGGADQILPVDVVEEAAAALRRWRVPISLDIAPQAGADLLFQHPDAVAERLVPWFESLGLSTET